tara:strand:- start:36 stop:596 length:561 start_codon:yes stop_codon:yes gene_type:complete
MIFEDYYIEVDLKKKLFLGKFQKLPSCWKNIMGFSSLSDEELKDLEWSGNEGVGWIRFTSPDIKNFFTSSENFMMNKRELKKDIDILLKQYSSFKMSYKHFSITINEEIKMILESRYLLSLMNDSIEMKFECDDGKYRSFKGEEIQDIIRLVDKERVSTYNKKINMFEMIDSSNSIVELTLKSYDI